MKQILMKGLLHKFALDWEEGLFNIMLFTPPFSFFSEAYALYACRPARFTNKRPAGSDQSLFLSKRI